MSVTLKDIAEKTGVSYATVSRALNNRPEVHAETRVKIFEAARELGYRPHAAARSLVTRRSGALALIIPDITNPFFPEVARGVEEAASRAGYHVFLCNTDWDGQKELSFLELLETKRADGLILASAQDDGTTVQRFARVGLPLVVLNNLFQEPECHQVVVDNAAGGRLAARHLLGLGHRRIAFIGGHGQAKSTADRMEGYGAALREEGLDPAAGLIRLGSFKWESGEQSAKELFQLKERPTAIFAANDLLALGVLQAAEDAGLNVPADLAVVGFDDIAFAAYPGVQLTTVAQPKYQLGQMAAKAVLEQLSLGVEAPRQRIVLQPSLVVRKTCGASCI